MSKGNNTKEIKKTAYETREISDLLRGGEGDQDHNQEERRKYSQSHGCGKI
jgi:hypothetical protein